MGEDVSLAEALAALADEPAGTAADPPLRRVANELASLPAERRAATLGQLESSGAVSAMVRMAKRSLDRSDDATEADVEQVYVVLSALANLADLGGQALVRTSGGLDLLLSLLGSEDETAQFYCAVGVQNMVSEAESTEQVILRGYEPILQLLAGSAVQMIAECALSALINVHTMLATFPMRRVREMHSATEAFSEQLRADGRPDAAALERGGRWRPASTHTSRDRWRWSELVLAGAAPRAPSDALRWRAALEIQRHERGRIARARWLRKVAVAMSMAGATAQPPRLGDLDGVSSGPLLALVKRALRAVSLTPRRAVASLTPRGAPDDALPPTALALADATPTAALGQLAVRVHKALAKPASAESALFVRSLRGSGVCAALVALFTNRMRASGPGGWIDGRGSGMGAEDVDALEVLALSTLASIAELEPHALDGVGALEVFVRLVHSGQREVRFYAAAGLQSMLAVRTVAADLQVAHYVTFGQEGGPFGGKTLAKLQALRAAAALEADEALHAVLDGAIGNLESAPAYAALAAIVQLQAYQRGRFVRAELRRALAVAGLTMGGDADASGDEALHVQRAEAARLIADRARLMLCSREGPPPGVRVRRLAVLLLPDRATGHEPPLGAAADALSELAPLLVDVPPEDEAGVALAIHEAGLVHALARLLARVEARRGPQRLAPTPRAGTPRLVTPRSVTDTGGRVVVLSLIHI